MLGWHVECGVWSVEWTKHPHVIMWFKSYKSTIYYLPLNYKLKPNLYLISSSNTYGMVKTQNNFTV